MKVTAKDLPVLIMGALIVATGVLLALARGKPEKTDLHNVRMHEPEKIFRYDPNAVHGAPKLLQFKGDLDLGGIQGPDQEVFPFVIGEVLSLEVEARNVREFRWSCNGMFLTTENDGWTAASKSEFEINAAGSFLFVVQGRTGATFTKELEKRIEAAVLKIESFDGEVTSVTTSNRFLTGETLTLQVVMLEPLREVKYEFRYTVNQESLKDPATGAAWTSNDFLTYPFSGQGTFYFKVDVRREGVEDVEDSMSLPVPVRAADAVIECFDATPKGDATLDHARVGQEVVLDAVTRSLTEPIECRFGVLDVQHPGSGIEWLESPEAAEWGASTRIWTPTKSGNYRIRVEIRDEKGEDADDFEELIYTVLEEKDEKGDF